MKVKEIMTSDVTACRPGDNLASVAAAMWDACCGVLPVLDARGAVSGMITDRDICVALGTRDRPASEVRVSDVSLPRVFTCGADDEVRSALTTMASQNVRRLPVVDKQDMLVGILSIDDVLLHAEKRPAKAGISYVEVVEAAKKILLTRKKEHKHEPAELVAAGRASG